MTFTDTSSTPPQSERPDENPPTTAGEPRSWSRSEPVEPPPATPTVTFRTPGGGHMRISTDRVRAKPAVAPQVAFGLGQAAMGLGALGLLAPGWLARRLGLSSPGALRTMFGAREMVSGIVLASDPTNTRALWGRVAGDVFDVVALRRLNTPDNPKRSNARLALGLVLTVAALDLFAAVRMSGVQRNCDTENR